MIKFGLFVGARVNGVAQNPNAGDSIGLSDFVDYVVEADRLGYANLFVVEHHFTGYGQVSGVLNLLSYLAARTHKMRLGTAVIVLPWHNPALLAEQVATLDLLSGGRFDFGIGKGYRVREFEAFGIPPEEADERFQEAFDFLKTAWTSPSRFSFEGKWARFKDIVVEPPPLQEPHPPFWMAARSHESARRAARNGLNLLLDQVVSIEAAGELFDVFRDEKQRLGLPFDAQQVCLTRHFRFADDDGERRRILSETADILDAIGFLRGLDNGQGAPEARKRQWIASDAGLIGTPAQIVERLRQLERSGFEHVCLNEPLGSVEVLRRFASDVAPQFRVAALNEV